MDRWSLKQEVNLDAGGSCPMLKPGMMMMAGDNRAHTWSVTAKKGSQAVDLAGCTAKAYCKRSDGWAVEATGSIAGNVVSVTLPAQCYAVAGDVQCIMQLVNGTDKITIAMLYLKVGPGIGSNIIPT